ncbi:hypothetical protein DIPPA_09261 [Diplonema papillatum]|nr:hypothetical protein DIPPA_09261 [Diplonema papillatum]
MAETTRDLASIHVIKDAKFVKGGMLTKIKSNGSEKRWEYALCAKTWYKVRPDGSKVEWQEEYSSIHSVEIDVEDTRRFLVWYYNGKKATKGYPALSSRSLQCAGEGERDDWLSTFKTLLTNYWHESLEATMVPAPEVYQWHLFVTGPAEACPQLLVLSTHLLRLARLPKPTQVVSAFETKFSDIASITRSKGDHSLTIATASKRVDIKTKDSIEALTVIAEIKRLVRMVAGRELAVDVKG